MFGKFADRAAGEDGEGIAAGTLRDAVAYREERLVEIVGIGGFPIREAGIAVAAARGRLLAKVATQQRTAAARRLGVLDHLCKSSLGLSSALLEVLRVDRGHAVRREQLQTRWRDEPRCAQGSEDGCVAVGVAVHLQAPAGREEIAVARLAGLEPALPGLAHAAFVGVRLVDEVLLAGAVAVRVEQCALGGVAVAAGAPSLLVVGLEARG